MAQPIPFAKLGISTRLEPQLAPDAPRKVRLAVARGVMPLPPNEQLAALYALACQEDPEVREAAVTSIRDLPDRVVLQALSIKTHPKVMEFLVEFRPASPELDERIGMMRTANDRTVETIAMRAGKGVCEMLARNHERLLVTPAVFVSLHANENCPDFVLETAASFLRMQRSLPDVPEVRPFLLGGDDLSGAATAGPRAPSGQTAATPSLTTPSPTTPSPTTPSPSRAGPAAKAEMDLLAEVEAALRGEQSPAFVAAQKSSLDMFDLDALDGGSKTGDSGLGGHEAFSFDFTDEDDAFSWDLTRDLSGNQEDRNEVRRSLEQKVKDLSVGHKIKLAYRGNKECRALLIRDTNKVVAAAVVRSGRLTDQEVAAFAGNKNLDNEVLREIANNKEFTRKYPVKVALVNNPKTPVSTAVGLVKAMQKKDLMSLSRNRNVPSVVTEAANRLYRKKYRK